MKRSIRPAPFLGYLSDLRSLHANVKLFLTVTAFRGMVIASAQTVFNLYLYSLGYDAPFIGIINAVNSLAVFVVSVPLGILADRVGRRPILLAGGIAYPFTLILLSLTHSTLALLIFNFLFGATASTYWVGGVPLLYASTRPSERAQVFSLNSFLLWGLGPLGAFLSGGVVEIAAQLLHVSASSSTSLRYGMFFMAAMGILGAIPYPFLSDLSAEGAERHEEGDATGLIRLMVQLLLPDLVLAFGIGAILTFVQLYFHVRFGLDPGPIGLIMALGGVIGGVGTLCTPIAARRWGNLRSAVRFQWAAAPLMACLAVATQLAVAVPTYWAVLVLRGMTDPVYTAFVQEQVPEAYRSRLTGMYSVTYSIGFSLGPSVSGALQSIGGFTPAFLMGAAFYMGGAVLLYLFFGRVSRFRAPGEQISVPGRAAE